MTFSDDLKQTARLVLAVTVAVLLAPTVIFWAIACAAFAVLTFAGKCALWLIGKWLGNGPSRAPSPIGDETRTGRPRISR